MPPSTPPRTSSPINPSTPPSSSRSTRTAPSPSLSRPPSTALGATTPESRYPPYRNLVAPTPTTAPATPLRNHLLARDRRPTTPSTFQRAINTALPSTPPRAVSSSAPHNDDVELLPYDSPTPRSHSRSRQQHTQSQSQAQAHASPFHDRHSVILDQTDQVDELDWSPRSGKQRTVPGYKFAGTGGHEDEVEELDFGEELSPVYISEKRRSLYPPASTLMGSREFFPDPSEGAADDAAPPPAAPPFAEAPTVRPRFRRLFALSTSRDVFFLLVPGVLLAGASAFVPPFMSNVIGDTFQVFAEYPLVSATATPEQRAALRDGIAHQTILLASTGLFAIASNYAQTVVWAWHGEGIAARLRQKVFEGVQDKRMEWFDTGMGMRDGEGDTIGAGGLMAKFSKETDDVRIATSQPMGNFVQYLISFALCFALAMVKAPTLALVTLSTIPLVVIVQIITQVFVAPLYASERRGFAEASTEVERSTNAIATVKAHNAQPAEKTRFDIIIARVRASLVRQAVVWGVSISVTDFLLLGTFVSGFWFGADLVRRGKLESGAVMTVFWACLLASSYLQMAVPTLTFITKGKMSMASLMTVLLEPTTPANRPLSISNPFSPAGTPSSPDASFPRGPQARATKSGLRLIKCIGEFNLRSVSFAYPSRPDVPVLRDITLFLPPSETTFIVGGSGSGKSTIAQLLLRLYDPLGGDISLDEQSFAHLDQDFLRENIAAVQQGCILFDLSVHDNVALGRAGAGEAHGRKPEDVSRREVEEACKMAMIHDFIVGLPEGYETRLGTGGSSLSGGQRQRLAIARARIRDPSVLILDEATSALDATSRVQVFENIKAWRQNRTTVVITHDLSQIVPSDFVYVMNHGVVAEQGFRSDLMRKTPAHGFHAAEADAAGEAAGWGVFASLAAEQAIEPVPLKWEESVAYDQALAVAASRGEGMEELDEGVARRSVRPGSFVMRPQSMAYFDILDEYSRGGNGNGTGENQNRAQGSGSGAEKRLSWAPKELVAKTSRSSLAPPTMGMAGSRLSYGHGYPSRPSSVMSNAQPHRLSRPASRMSRQISFEGSPLAITAPHTHSASPRAGTGAGLARASTSYERIVDARQRTLSQNLEDDIKAGSTYDLSIAVLPHSPTAPSLPVTTDEEKAPLPSIFRVVFSNIPLMPHRWMFLFGLVGALGHGVCTPVWAQFLSRLMIILAGGGTDPMLTTYALIVLAISAAQALAGYVQEWALYAVAAHWTASVRSTAYERVLRQDKGWFDRPESAPAVLVQTLIKDADDMRAAVSQIAGKMVVFASMVTMGVIWAMAVQWCLTLVGLSIAPVFAAVVVVNEVLVGRAETRNKDMRDRVGKMFYESVANIRGIRAMALESTFREKFGREALAAQQTGKRTGYFVGIGVSASAAMPLAAMSLLNWVGCKFILDDYMDYAQMLMVYNLVLFSLTFGSQALDFIPMMAKVKVAARDFNRLYYLTSGTSESTGDLRFPITGHIRFDDVHFAYPSRPDVAVLNGVSFTLKPGECVAIVGPSGSGKSTIAALLQRLYEPSPRPVAHAGSVSGLGPGAISGAISGSGSGSGSIKMGTHDLASADVKWLRDHIAVVSQTANLFDASIAENIAYGSDVPIGEVHRAAKAANIHEFIMTLPRGYETGLGENASLISGGQAQRLQIARALVRRSNVLILDEATSALDVENARAVLDTVVRIKETRTTIFITHSVEAMKRCDRVICLEEGRVAEDGPFDELVRRGGTFAQLMRMGEWE